MVEDRVEPREGGWRPRLPGAELFQGFKVAFGFHQIALAVAGILVMALGWWLLAVIFNTAKPEWRPDAFANDEQRVAGWRDFKVRLHQWNVRHEAAGTDPNHFYGADDVADSFQEYKRLSKFQDLTRKQLLTDIAQKEAEVRAKEAEVRALESDANRKKPKEELEKLEEDLKRLLEQRGQLDALEADPQTAPKLALMWQKVPKPYGRLRTWPWQEDRGPNPYLLATGQAGEKQTWQRGQFFEWLAIQQVPVLLEPLAKMLRPVLFFLRPNIGFLNSLYFLLVILWTVATWSIFGGAITRIAAVRLARQETIYSLDALGYVKRHALAFVGGPLVPLALVGMCLLVMMVFGLLHMIPFFGDLVVSGLFWWLMLIVGLVMAGLLVGLVGWPMMAAAVSVEGADVTDAFTRCYQYVIQAPWRYLWYNLLALLYGAVIFFFFGFMASLGVYLAKWGVSQTPGIEAANREPSFLFVYAPQSYGWRDLLLQGATVGGKPVVDPTTGQVDPVQYERFLGRAEGFQNHPDSLTTVNAIGAGMVTVWLVLLFLAVLGFSYSYFWTASTIIFMLLRRDLDDHDLEEVHMDDEDDLGFAGPLVSAVPAPTGNAGVRQPLPLSTSLPMAPAPAPPPPPPPPPVTPPAQMAAERGTTDEEEPPTPPAREDDEPAE